MSPKRIITLARRVIQQFMADRRTIALIIIAPILVLTMAGILLRTDTSKVTIGVVIQDQGAQIPLLNTQINLGQRLTDNLASFSDSVQIQNLKPDEAETLLEQGKLD